MTQALATQPNPNSPARREEADGWTAPAAPLRDGAGPAARSGPRAYTTARIANASSWV
jgi:hypothetical protein